jgi:hypothetical protein
MSGTTNSDVLARATLIQINKSTVSFRLPHPPHDLQFLCGEIFFAYYVPNFSHTWDFLFAYLDSTAAPEHLSLDVDAVNFAFLSHQASSPTARKQQQKKTKEQKQKQKKRQQKYVEALEQINKVIQDPRMAPKMSAIESMLLLDLFEKMTIRGVENFRKGPELRALLGLSPNATIFSLSTCRAIPDEAPQIRKHAAQFVDTFCPKWRLSDCIPKSPTYLMECTICHHAIESPGTPLDYRFEIVALEAGNA